MRHYYGRRKKYRLCSIEGCKGNHQALGLCLDHYQAYHKLHGKRKCSIKNCNKPHLAKGFCQKHYKQWKRKTLLYFPEKNYIYN